MKILFYEVKKIEVTARFGSRRTCPKTQTLITLIQIQLLITSLVRHIGKNKLKHFLSGLHTSNAFSLRYNSWWMKWIKWIFIGVIKSSVGMYHSSLLNDNWVLVGIIVLPFKIPFINFN